MVKKLILFFVSQIAKITKTHTNSIDRAENELKRLSVHYILKIVITFSNMDAREL